MADERPDLDELADGLPSGVRVRRTKATVVLICDPMPSPCGGPPIRRLAFLQTSRPSAGWQLERMARWLNALPWLLDQAKRVAKLEEDRERVREHWRETWMHYCDILRTALAGEHPGLLLCDGDGEDFKDCLAQFAGQLDAAAKRVEVLEGLLRETLGALGDCTNPQCGTVLHECWRSSIQRRGREALEGSET